MATGWVIRYTSLVNNWEKLNQAQLVGYLNDQHYVSIPNLGTFQHDIHILSLEVPHRHGSAEVQHHGSAIQKCLCFWWPGWWLMADDVIFVKDWWLISDDKWWMNDEYEYVYMSTKHKPRPVMTSSIDIVDDLVNRWIIWHMMQPTII